MIKHSIRANGNGDPVLTIRITGFHDIFRLAWNLIHAQIEFMEIGRHGMRYTARSLGKGRFAAMDKSMTGGEVVKHGYQKRLRSEKEAS